MAGMSTTRSSSAKDTAGEATAVMFGPTNTWRSDCSSSRDVPTKQEVAAERNANSNAGCIRAIPFRITTAADGRQKTKGPRGGFPPPVPICVPVTYRHEHRQRIQAVKDRFLRLVSGKGVRTEWHCNSCQDPFLRILLGPAARRQRAFEMQFGGRRSNPPLRATPLFGLWLRCRLPKFLAAFTNSDHTPR
jgi:hypothetical protein